MKLELKKLAAVCAMALFALPLVAEMPRSEWHAKVSECAQDSKALQQIMSQVSASDQTALLSEVNAAIASMPGSDEVKAAKFYEANSAAVKSAAKGNLPAVLAEVFATVPPEYLTDINERFAKEIFNRSNTTGQKVTDGQFIILATNTMAVINERCEKAENGAVRETFAALMFVRASGGSPEGLADSLVSTMPEGNRQNASEWIKQATGADGQEASYDGMLGTAQAGEEPDHAMVTRLTGPGDVNTALLGDLAAQSSDVKTPTANLGGGVGLAPGSIAGAAPAMAGTWLERVPRAFVNSEDPVGGDSEGRAKDNDDGEGNPYYTRRRGSSSGSHQDDEPIRYLGQ